MVTWHSGRARLSRVAGLAAAAGAAHRSVVIGTDIFMMAYKETGEQCEKTVRC